MTDTSVAPAHPVPVAGTGPGPQARPMRSIVNPATGEVIATVPEQGAAEVDRAVAAARAAFESGTWPTMARSRRARLLLTLADAVESHSGRLFELETRNNGRPITETTEA